MSIRPLIRAARPRSTAPRRRILAVGNHWQVTEDGNRRQVTVRLPDGRVVTDYLPDAHPALVRFLDRAQAVAA